MKDINEARAARYTPAAKEWRARHKCGSAIGCLKTHGKKVLGQKKCNQCIVLREMHIVGIPPSLRKTER